jgi:hypothetical protein
MLLVLVSLHLVYAILIIHILLSTMGHVHLSIYPCFFLELLHHQWWVTVRQHVCSSHHKLFMSLGAVCILEYPLRSFLPLVHRCLFSLNLAREGGKRFLPILFHPLVPVYTRPACIHSLCIAIPLCLFSLSSQSRLSSLFPYVARKLDILVYQVLLVTWSTMFPIDIKHQVYVSIGSCII